MKTATATIALSAIAVCMIGGTDGHAQVEKAAAVQSRTGVPLQALGQGNERELVVEKDVSPPLSVLPPAGTSELAWMTSISDVVLLVRVQTIEPKVTNEQDWITSQVSALVLDVLKGPAAGEIQQGASVTFAQDGGAMVINGRRIRAELPYARGFSVGRTYLLFATPGEAPGELIVGPESTFEVQSNSQLASLKTRGTPSVESEIPLEIARQRIRSAAAPKPR
jgi:hypothetical protein